MINNTPPRVQATPEERRKIARIFADMLASDPAFFQHVLAALTLFSLASTMVCIGDIVAGAKMMDRLKEKCEAQGIKFPDMSKGNR